MRQQECLKNLKFFFAQAEASCSQIRRIQKGSWVQDQIFKSQHFFDDGGSVPGVCYLSAAPLPELPLRQIKGLTI